MNPIDDPKPIKPGDVIAMDGPPIYAEAARSTEDLAREAGMEMRDGRMCRVQRADTGHYKYVVVMQSVALADLERFAALVRAQAVEDSALALEAHGKTMPDDEHERFDNGYQCAIENGAAAVRALKEKP